MEITAKMVRELRERSGAPMMECKRALAATDGDLEGAFDHLRKAGLKSADKKSSRATGEGRVRVQINADGTQGVMIALTCETDFVAKTDDFARLLEQLSDHLAVHGPDTPDSMLGQILEPVGSTVEEAIKALIGKLGENMQIARIARFENTGGRVGGYLHHTHRVGALVSLTHGSDPDKAEAFLKQLGMHIAASKPLALTREEIPADQIERERAVYSESDDVKSKPADKHEQIIEGKLQKFFKEQVLLEQPWVHDPKSNVQKALADALGAGAKIESFALFQIGV
jgi:elongation factor Ts